MVNKLLAQLARGLEVLLQVYTLCYVTLPSTEHKCKLAVATVTKGQTDFYITASLSNVEQLFYSEPYNSLPRTTLCRRNQPARKNLKKELMQSKMDMTLHRTHVD